MWFGAISAGGGLRRGDNMEEKGVGQLGDNKEGKLADVATREEEDDEEGSSGGRGTWRGAGDRGGSSGHGDKGENCPPRADRMTQIPLRLLPHLTTIILTALEQTFQDLPKLKFGFISS